ncbi:FecR/PupR family sigma factor regulator [Microbulbifer guangxiensis]|uniref:FecR/PupR family sigma factor regulator n=1 Tax=Microbulbifer guangxiensis TaxID=2904249 RepID=UPI001F28D5D7|nr:DUF4880 domain-containing protein [Microbulbifer guangxiensis]
MQLDEWLCIGIPDDVMEQASAWLARLDADHVSLDERRQLAVWLDDDPLHRWAFEELSQLYARAASLSHVRGQIHAPQVMIFPQVATPRQQPAIEVGPAPAPGNRWQSVIALLLIVAGLALALRGPGGTSGETIHYQPSWGTERFLINGE